jgi:uncharacterized protein (TIGR00730 family)
VNILKTRYSINEIREKFGPIITIFGSSSCKEESELYNMANKVGKILAMKGYTTASGGYTCIMDAISKGTVENNGKSIGITTDEITMVKASKYLTEEFREKSLMSRLELMINIAEAFVFLPGSTGTLTELALVWDKQKLGLIPIRPSYLIGKTWHKVFNIMFNNSDHLVKRSKWKKDLEVEKACELIDSIEELKLHIENKKK